MKVFLWARPFPVRLALAAVLAPLLSLLVVGSYALFETTAALERSAQDSHLHEVRLIAQSLRAGLEQPRTDLLELTQHPSLRRLSTKFYSRDAKMFGEVSAVFKSLVLRSNGIYRRVYWLDPQAQPLASSDPLGFVGRTQFELSALVNGASGLIGIPGQMSVYVAPVNAVLGSSSAKADYLQYALAIQTADRAVMGVLVLELNVSSLWRSSLKLNVNDSEPDQRLWLLSHQGWPVDTWPEVSGVTLPQDLAATLSVSEGVRSVLAAPGDTGPRMQAYARVRPEGQSSIRWTVLRDTPPGNGFEQLIAVRRTLLVLSLTGVFLSMLIVAWLTRPLVQGIQSLAVAAKRLGDGDFDVRLPKASNVELQLMTRAFRRMRTKLRSSKNEQVRTLSLLDTSQLLSRTGGWHLDLVNNRQHWTDATFALHDLSPRIDGRGLEVDEGLTYYKPAHRKLIRAAIDECIRHATPIDLEAELVGAKGNERWVRIVGIATRESGRTLNITGAIQDVTEAHKAQQQIQRLVFRDGLTELPNRRWVLDRLQAMLSDSREAGHQGALLYIDLDHFKNINDTKGHGTGDKVLIAASKRLLSCIPTGCELARLGGDEFVVTVPGEDCDTLVALSDAQRLAETILQTLDAPLETSDGNFTVGCSVGIGHYPKPKQTVDDLLREADTAMYRAKAQGRGQVVTFADSMRAEVEQRLAFQSDLKQALTLNQFQVFVQSQVNNVGETVGAELLIRWQHPVHGLVSPVHFIPVAEETGLIMPMGQWMLQNACSVIANWLGPRFPLSVNVSPKQFRQIGFVEQVAQTLETTGADGQWLILEVTEGLFMQDVDACAEVMRSIQKLGVRFSIDDFGTGYSSLSYLKRLPLYELKIDRTFVAGLPGESQDRAIVESVLAMAAALGLEVVGEGVETTEQAEALINLGCQRLQGYLYARPVALADWLTELQGTHGCVTKPLGVV